jgi:hypothetical protein
MGILRFTNWSALAIGGALLTGCLPAVDDGGQASVSGTESALNSTNGLSDINGLSATNGLSGNGLSGNGLSGNGLSGNGLSGNGLSGNGLSGNGLSGNGLVLNALSSSGLTPTSYLMNSADGRSTISYLVRCALPAGTTLTKKDQNGASYSFTGQIGVAPQWNGGTCDVNCQQLVSACLLAHVNTSGQHIAIWLDGDSPAMGWGQSASFPFQEGSFFGNVFTNPPLAYYCNGKDFDHGVVPGRLGADQPGAPYIDPFGSGVLCKARCTGANAAGDGWSSCPGTGNSVFRHVVTVWRNFDPNTQYKICNKTSGKCLDVAGSSTANGAQIVQRTYGSAPSQKWTISPGAPGKYKILNVNSGRSIDMTRESLANGTVLVQNAYTGSANQTWTITSMADGTGFSKLMPSSSASAAMTLPTSGLFSDGQSITISQYITGDFQKWSLAVAN